MLLWVGELSSYRYPGSRLCMLNNGRRPLTGGSRTVHHTSRMENVGQRFRLPFHQWVKLLEA
jgi:hypothetical protein